MISVRGGGDGRWPSDAGTLRRDPAWASGCRWVGAWKWCRERVTHGPTYKLPTYCVLLYTVRSTDLTTRCPSWYSVHGGMDGWVGNGGWIGCQQIETTPVRSTKEKTRDRERGKQNKKITMDGRPMHLVHEHSPQATPPRVKIP